MKLKKNFKNKNKINPMFSQNEITKVENMVMRYGINDTAKYLVKKFKKNESGITPDSLRFVISSLVDGNYSEALEAAKLSAENLNEENNRKLQETIQIIRKNMGLLN